MPGGCGRRSPRLVHQVDVSPPVVTSGRGAVAEAVSAVGEAAAAVRRLLGTAVAAVSPWEVAAAVSHGRLLAVSPPARLFSTSAASGAGHVIAGTLVPSVFRPLWPLRWEAPVGY